jgi:hypothetical protein
MIAGCANDRVQFRYLVNSPPHKTQCRERMLIVRIVGTRKTVSVNWGIRSLRQHEWKLTHHKTFNVLDTCPIHGSAGQQDADARPNEDQTPKGYWYEPV